MSVAISPAIAERAVQWLVELQSPPVTEQTYAQWQQWRNEHPHHEAAWQRIEAFSQRLGPMRSGANNSLLYATLEPRTSRRRALKHLALLIAAGTVAWSAKEQPWRSDYRSGVGAQRLITLADGTRVQLNTDTALNVHFDQQQRLIQLRAGEILVTSGHDPLGRRLLVETAEGRTSTMSASFSVRQHSGFTQVGAYAQSVELTPVNAPRSWTLGQGQGTRMDREQVFSPSPLPAHELAWTNGMVVADNQRLEDFLVNLARYRQGHLGCDQAIADRRICGSYPLADTDRVLAALSNTLQLDVKHFTRYWTRLVPRQRSA